jgi:hypothetical protein
MSFYSASFTTGPLLTDEIDAVIKFMDENDQQNLEVIIKTDKILRVNSVAGRKRRLREILNRIESVPEGYWNFYRQLSGKEEKSVFLYYVCMKYYSLVRDFHLEVILSKWRVLDTSYGKEEVERFLMRASMQHPEVDGWTEGTRKKISQVLTLMLKEVGIVAKEKIRLIFLPDKFWIFFIQHGEGWFLEAMFLTREQRDLLYKKAGL